MRQHRMIISRVGILALLATLVGVPAWAVEERHSGTVMAVDPRAATVTIEELVEDGRARTLTVQVPAQARVVLSEPMRPDTFTSAGELFRDTPLSLGDVRPGDFVVLEMDGAGSRVASAVVITLRPAK
jgi:hypothetical protein